MLFWAWPATGDCASAGSGCGTEVIGSFENGEKTCGKPPCASTVEKSENQVLACGGTTRETPNITLDSRTSLLTVGSEVPATREPSSQATISIARTFTSAPPVASRARAGDQVMYRRSLFPRWVVAAWPTDAHTITSTIATMAPKVPGEARSVVPSQMTGRR